MSTAALDTHATVKDLKAAGFTDLQAEAVTRILKTSQDFDLTGLAAKVDIREAEMRLDAKIEAAKGDIRESELRLDAKIEATKAEIIKWMFGTIGFQTLVIIGALIALVRIVKP